MIKIVLADDDPIIREGLKMIIETQSDLQYMGCAENGRDVVGLCRKTKPDVVLLDIRMPIQDGIEAAIQIQKEELSLPLLLTTFDERELIFRALKAGVNGYILKNSPAERILAAIRAVAAGGTVFQKDVLEYITEQVREEKRVKDDIFVHLTERELEVAELVSRGLSNKEISAALYISDGTVRNHISVILDKTRLEHRTQIAIEYLSRS